MIFRNILEIVLGTATPVFLRCIKKTTNPRSCTTLTELNLFRHKCNPENFNTKLFTTSNLKLSDIQGVSGEIVNILESGSMDYSE
jgi:hypothetical protein